MHALIDSFMLNNNAFAEWFCSANSYCACFCTKKGIFTLVQIMVAGIFKKTRIRGQRLVKKAYIKILVVEGQRHPPYWFDSRDLEEGFLVCQGAPHLETNAPILPTNFSHTNVICKHGEWLTALKCADFLVRRIGMTSSCRSSSKTPITLSGHPFE